jgi:hypothetical protein
MARLCPGRELTVVGAHAREGLCQSSVPATQAAVQGRFGWPIFDRRALRLNLAVVRMDGPQSPFRHSHAMRAGKR